MISRFRRRRALLPVATMILSLVGIAVVAPAAFGDQAIDKLGFAGKIPTEVGLNSAWVV
ncbi:MAG: hypothetical protein F2813_05240, partial [Actinobacteria bacterium]|nr:hypothetical protein [Actinomycetota bacterium]